MRKKVIFSLLCLLGMLILVGCEMKQKMVIYYAEHEEIVLVDKLQSELGFTMDVIYDLDISEDLEEQTLHIGEPYPMHITVLENEKDGGLDALFEYLNTNNLLGTYATEFNYYDPGTAQLDSFDLLLIGEDGEHAIFFLVKEMKDLFYIIETIIAKEEVVTKFPKLRAMLSSLEVVGEEVAQLRDLFFYLPPYRGEFEDIVIHYFQYEEEKKQKSLYGELPVSQGDVSVMDDSKEELYRDLIWERTHFQPPTGRYFSRFDEGYTFSSLITSSYHIDYNPNGRAGFYFYDSRADLTLRYTFAEIGNDFEQLEVLGEGVLRARHDYHELQIDFLDKKDVYYVVVVEAVDEDGMVRDTFEKIMHITQDNEVVKLSLDKESYRLSETLLLAVENLGNADFYSFGDPYVERLENGEWWKIPYDGYVENNSPFYAEMYITSRTMHYYENIPTEGLKPGEYRMVLGLHSYDPMSEQEIPFKETVLAVPFALAEAP